eukprot:ctg_5472.g603
MAGWRLAGVVAAADGAHASRTAFTESDGDAASAGKRRKIHISGERLGGSPTGRHTKTDRHRACDRKRSETEREAVHVDASDQRKRGRSARQPFVSPRNT